MWSQLALFVLYNYQGREIDSEHIYGQLVLSKALSLFLSIHCFLKNSSHVSCFFDVDYNLIHHLSPHLLLNVSAFISVMSLESMLISEDSRFRCLPG